MAHSNAPPSSRFDVNDPTPRGEPTLLSSVLGGISAYAMGRGLSAKEVREAAGGSLVELMQPDRRSSYRDGLRLWNLIAERFPHEPVGLRFAQQIPLSAFGPLYYAARHAPNPRAALDVWLRYHRISSSHLTVRIVGNETEIEHHPQIEAQPHIMDTTMMLGWRQFVSLTGDEGLVERVDFKHSACAPRAVYEDAFNAEVRFEQPRYGMVFDELAFEQPITSANPQLFRYLETHLEKAHAEVLAMQRGPRQRYLDEVHTAIHDLAERNVYGVTELADVLGVTTRTLQRKTSDLGVSVKDLIDQHRQARASRLLSKSMLSIDDIAFVVGYSDARAFRRAFKRWTGATPAEYRRGVR